MRLATVCFGTSLLALAACKGDPKPGESSSSHGPADPDLLGPYSDRAPGDREKREALNAVKKKYRLTPSCISIAKADAWRVIGEWGGTVDVWLANEFTAADAKATCQKLCGDGWRLPDALEFLALHETEDLRLGHPPIAEFPGEDVTTKEQYWLADGSFIGVQHHSLGTYIAPQPAKPDARNAVLCTKGLAPPPAWPARPEECVFDDHVPAFEIEGFLASPDDWPRTKESIAKFQDATLHVDLDRQKSLMAVEHHWKRDPADPRERVDFDIQLQPDRLPFVRDLKAGATYDVRRFADWGIELSIRHGEGPEFVSESGTLTIDAWDGETGKLTGHFDKVGMRDKRERGCATTLDRVAFTFTVGKSD